MLDKDIITNYVLNFISVPTFGPKIVSVSNISSYSMFVRFETIPVIERQGIILGYTLHFNDSFVTTNNTEVLLTALNASTNYWLSVSGFTSAGNGPTGPFVQATTLEPCKSRRTLFMVSLVNNLTSRLS